MQIEFEFLKYLILSLLLGSVIGIERERNHQNQDQQYEFGGIRTMSLISMFGFLLYKLFGDNVTIFAIFIFGFWMLIVASYVASSLINKNTGATTEIAALFVFLIGVLVAMNQQLFAATVTLLVVMLLYFKGTLHTFAKKIEKEEFYDTIKFIAVAFIILPLLPNKTFDSLQVINPYQIWFFVVLICAISFVSYIAIKLLGARRGVGLSGFFGGLISSTALSISLSQLSKKNSKIVNPIVFGILLACSAMFFRVLIEVSVLNSEIFRYLGSPIIYMGLTGFLLSIYFWMKSQNSKKDDISSKEIYLKSPLQLGSAIKFAFLIVCLLFISKYASIHYGSNAIYLTAFITGLVDVDAITVSVSNLSKDGSLSLELASAAITIAVITNTFVKALIVLAFASKDVARKTFFALLTVILVGILSLYLTNPEFLYGFIRI